MSESFRPRGRWAALVAALGLATGLLVAAAATPAAAAPTPFSCDTSTVFLAQDFPTQLKSQLATSGSDAFNPVGPNSGITYNAIGYNTADNFIYGISGTDLIKIDSTGAVTTLAPMGFVANNGTFGQNGVFYAAMSLQKVLRAVNVTTFAVTNIPLSANLSVADFVSIDNQLWGPSGRSSQSMTRIDPSTGTVVSFPAPFLPASLNSGATWIYGNGDLGISDNNTGVIYRVKITNPTSGAPGSPWSRPSPARRRPTTTRPRVKVRRPTWRCPRPPRRPCSLVRPSPGPSRSPTTARVSAPATRSPTPCPPASPASPPPRPAAASSE